MKTFYSLITSFALTLILSYFIGSCTRKNENLENAFTRDASKEQLYRKIIDTLDRYDYVPLFRHLVKYDSDFRQDNNWGFSKDTSKFLHDSIQYYASKKAFFQQDRELLHWLLDFRNDTIRTAELKIIRNLQGKVIYKINNPSVLWIPYQSPLLSKIPRCLRHSSNHIQAISLIHAFLNGPDKYMDCIECSGSNDCLDNSYAEVEAFLRRHTDVDIPTLRKLWQFRQDFHRLLS